MFQTTSSARHPTMSAIAGDNEDVWNYVTLAVNAPWYFATYDEEIDGVTLQSNVMLSTYQQVAELLSQQSNSFRVTDLLLATPRFINNSDSWKLEALSEIMIWIDPATKFKYSVFRLANGICYSDYQTGLGTTAQNHLQMVVKYQRPIN